MQAELDKPPRQKAGDVSPRASDARCRRVVRRSDGQDRIGIQQVEKIQSRLDLPSLRDGDVLSHAEIYLVVPAKGKDGLWR